MTASMIRAGDRPGRDRASDSAIHRCPAIMKLLVLAAIGTLVAVWGTLDMSAVVAGLEMIGFLTARVPGSLVWAQLRSACWMLLGLLGIQTLLGNLHDAIEVCASIAVVIFAAALLTLTTSVASMLDAIAIALRPLGRTGLDADRFSLLAMLTIRSIQVINDVATEVSQARRARGAGRSLRALLTPLVIRTAKHADQLGEALLARGISD